MIASALYLVAAGAMAVVACVPSAIATAPAWLGVVAAGWVSGVLLVRPAVTDLVAEYKRSYVFVLTLGSLLTPFSPVFPLFLLTSALLFVRSRELFGPILGLGLLNLGLGLSRNPSYGLAALFLLAAVCACHLRVARRLSPRPFIIAILILMASLAGGGIAALASKAIFWLPSLASQPSDPRNGPSVAPLIAALLLLPALAYTLVRYLSLRSGARANRTGSAKRVGRIVGEGEALEADARAFAGPPANDRIVRGYVEWRTQIAKRGLLFRRDRTAEESERYLLSRMRGVSEAAIGRMTQLFNAARYGAANLDPRDADEFERLKAEVLRQLS